MKCSTATGGFVDAETRTDNILFFCDGDGDGDHGDSNILIKKFSYLDTRSQEIFYNPYDCWTHKKGLLSCNR